MGPVLFNLFINDLLEELYNSNNGVNIGLIHIAALGFADDIVLISDSPTKLLTPSRHVLRLGSKE